MDIFFSDAYGQLNELIENGKAECFEYRTDSGFVRHLFIRRELPFLIDGEQYYDLITPYGYGGPAILSAREGERRALCAGFEEAFSAYCREQRIISEFVRFHPAVNNAADFRDLYHPVYMRKIPVTDLTGSEDPAASEFSKGCRKHIRRAMNKGVEYRVFAAPEDISAFTDIYYDTMKRDRAAMYYYFPRAYFDEMLRTLRHNMLYVEAVYEGKAIAAGIFFLSEGIVYAHLSGTLSEYLYLSPAYVLRYAAACWGKENGYRMLFHGGGTSNAEDNPLFLFKKQFTKNNYLDFYVGRKIWNQEIYDAAVKISMADDPDFFPLYRAR